LCLIPTSDQIVKLDFFITKGEVPSWQQQPISEMD